MKPDCKSSALLLCKQNCHYTLQIVRFLPRSAHVVYLEVNGCFASNLRIVYFEVNRRFTSKQSKSSYFKQNRLFCDKKKPRYSLELRG